MFILDTNIFIEAARRYYAFDIAPKFWSELIKSAEQGKLQSIDKVFRELEKGRDELAAWARESFKDFFISTDIQGVLDSYKKIVQSVQMNKQYLPVAKDKFAGSADGWLVAYAEYKRGAVVTHEVFNESIKNNVPIPNLCKEHSIPCMNTFDLLRKLNIRL